jgi:hypothetical protein
MMSPTSDVTMAPNAAPMMTPTARSITLPRIANFLNSSPHGAGLRSDIYIAGGALGTAGGGTRRSGPCVRTITQRIARSCAEARPLNATRHSTPSETKPMRGSWRARQSRAFLRHPVGLMRPGARNRRSGLWHEGQRRTGPFCRPACAAMLKPADAECMVPMPSPASDAGALGTLSAASGLPRSPRRYAAPTGAVSRAPWNFVAVRAPDGHNRCAIRWRRLTA